MSVAEFDRFACTYNEELAKSLAVTGESRDFYATERIAWTARCVSQLGAEVRHILDYGCGDGTNVPILAARFHADQVLGVDVSGASIAVARQFHQSAGTSFLTTEQWAPDGSMDLAFVNGVFHHIPLDERKASLAAIRQALHPNALLALWENNPWNPGTRYVMSRCAFDKDAVTISPRQARGMLSNAGFRILRFDFLFYFPRRLRLFRPAERYIRKLPFGGQYQVICRPS
jgi:trans-aconitate methyltransferase